MRAAAESGRSRVMRHAGTQPAPARVRGNDWRGVRAEPIATFAPRLPLSVVVPCFEAPQELALALAALERQSYPSELFEVVVVDDGSEPPVSVPPGTRLDVRVVRQPRRGFGLARARNRGVRAARHDLIVFLDGDVLAEADLLAAHARWHHAVADAVTLGFCAYVSAGWLDGEVIRNRPGTLADLFADRSFDVPWIERHMGRTADLTAPRDDLFRAVVGNNIGLRRGFFEEIDGFDESFDRYGGEDTEFGWRAQTRGGLLVPERGAMCWHQGRFAPNRRGAKRRELAAQSGKIAGLIAHPDFRPAGGGDWPVPRTVVAVDASGEKARWAPRTVESLLGDGDVAVLVDTGPDAADGARAALRARFANDARVRVGRPVEVLDAFPSSPFHVTLPAGAGVVPGLLGRLRAGLGDAAVGEATLPDGSGVVVARAWALHRSRRAGGRPGDYGPVAAFRVHGAVPAWLGAERLRHWLPRFGIRRGGVGRVIGEASRVRGLDDAVRFAMWLAVGLRWWLGTWRGDVRSAPARPGRRLRAAVRPRQLVALAVRRARGGRPGDLVAAARLGRAAIRSAASGCGAVVRGLGLADGPLERLPGSERGLGVRARRRPETGCSPARAAAAAEFAAALANGDRRTARSMARAAAHGPDRRAEKIVSRRYRFVWLATPKAASRSLIRVLGEADPDAVLVRKATLAEVYAGFPEARGYFSFAFVRHPVDRALSCHGDKVARDGNVALDVFHGLREGMDLDAFCEWLATPWGSDAFADRHWLSQDVLLRETDGGPLPDFLGRFENLGEDFAAVAGRLGLPAVTLPHLNRRPAPGPCPPSAVVRAALSRRYAADLALGGYAPVGTDGSSSGRAPARGGMPT